MLSDSSDKALNSTTVLEKGTATFADNVLTLTGGATIALLITVLASPITSRLFGPELEEGLGKRVAEFGVEIINAGIRDIILPGEMKELLNRVTEAKKAAEANLIARREETAAMRSQANTAKLLADNPTLMRLRELEVLETIASAGNMNIVLGEKGLADRVVNLL